MAKHACFVRYAEELQWLQPHSTFMYIFHSPLESKVREEKKNSLCGSTWQYHSFFDGVFYFIHIQHRLWNRTPFVKMLKLAVMRKTLHILRFSENHCEVNTGGVYSWYSTIMEHVGLVTILDKCLEFNYKHNSWEILKSHWETMMACSFPHKDHSPFSPHLKLLAGY